MELEKLISQKISEDKKEFSFTNNCEICKKLPDGKFCSKEHYDRTKFDYKDSYIKNSLLLASDYFEIKKDKEDEFQEFIQNILYIYY